MSDKTVYGYEVPEPVREEAKPQKVAVLNPTSRTSDAPDTRPTDMQIIEALAMHFRVHETTVVKWLLGMDLEAVQQEILKEFA